MRVDQHLKADFLCGPRINNRYRRIEKVKRFDSWLAVTGLDGARREGRQADDKHTQCSSAAVQQCSDSRGS
jgi:hypothetical protein